MWTKVPSSTTGAAVGVIGLANLAVEYFNRQKFDSENYWAEIRVKVLNDLKSDIIFKRIPQRDLNAADEALARLLPACTMDYKHLAEAAVHEDGFAKHAADMIAETLAKNEPMFAAGNGNEKDSRKTDDSNTCRQFAVRVLELALEAVWTNHAIFNEIAPYMLGAIAKCTGEIKSLLEDINRTLPFMRETVDSQVSSKKIDECFCTPKQPARSTLDHSNLQLARQHKAKDIIILKDRVQQKWKAWEQENHKLVDTFSTLAQMDLLAHDFRAANEHWQHAIATSIMVEKANEEHCRENGCGT